MMTLKEIADMDCTCDEKSNDLCPACEAAHVLNEIDEIQRRAFYEINAKIKMQYKAYVTRMKTVHYFDGDRPLCGKLLVGPLYNSIWRIKKGKVCPKCKAKANRNANPPIEVIDIKNVLN